MDNYTGDADYVNYGEIVFLRRCPECKRFVKADKTVIYEKNGLDDYKFGTPNATCKKHGRVVMEFMGFWGCE